MPRRIAFVVAIVIGSVYPDMTVRAASDAGGCAALANPSHAVRFAEIIDAPTAILSARIVPAGGDGSIIERDYPEHCDVEGQIAPNIGFVLRMLTTTWNGKFLMGGCGGPCGSYMLDRYDTALVRHYAVVVTDMGHKGSNWLFAFNNLDAMIDFGYRATHVTAVAAKEIVAAFYGKRAAQNFFWGCSTGGRQAMVEAQRFPHDFDGILAGAPVWFQTGNQPLFSLWATRINIGAGGKAILDSAKLPLVHRAVMEACDAIDGLKDGLLQDPRRCAWEPKSILCRGGTADTCLTPAEAEVVQKIYDGARNAKGEKLYWGMARGSEDQWAPIWINSGGKPGTALGDASGKALVTSYRSFYYPPGPSYSLFDFDYDRDPQRLALTESIYNAQNPDVRKFKAAGGKLILYTGWNDNNIPPEAAIDYYETATRTMGGSAATTDFFRLFLLPAVNHCQYGAGGGEADWLAALERWVERGEAPDQIIVHHMREEPYPSIDRPGRDGRATRFPRYPLDSQSYDRTRPVYPYPDVARWSGRGDAAQASTWQKARR
jgi:feruloyl esterase